jgi:hypothetical protein
MEYTDLVTIAIKLRIRTTTIGTLTLLSKTASNKGYSVFIQYETDTTFTLRFQHTYNGTTSVNRRRTGLSINNDYIMILSTAGSGLIDVMSVYNGAGSIQASLGQGSGGLTPNTSIKNTAQLGLYGGGVLGHISYWNLQMNSTQKDELALKIAQDKVKDHSLYASNCVGYWREFMSGKVINAVDPTYNGTYSGFTNP